MRAFYAFTTDSNPGVENACVRMCTNELRYISMKIKQELYFEKESHKVSSESVVAKG